MHDSSSPRREGLLCTDCACNQYCCAQAESPCCRDGLYLTTGFFSDIFIPEENLQDNSQWDDKDGHWYWQVCLGLL